MSDHDLEKIPTGELYRAVTIMMCNRMLFAADPEHEAEVDAKIASLEFEIARRKTKP